MRTSATEELEIGGGAVAVGEDALQWVPGETSEKWRRDTGGLQWIPGDAITGRAWEVLGEAGLGRSYCRRTAVCWEGS